ncbi:putative phosphoglycerate mutase [Arthrobacter stackebrandtii]|uniref:Phosphoglycerate mutase n=1 Tax=Arthrobacter stackebrandtii TaxID=272161 RepID=A0ABS4YWU4_9MICC|nr:histidine phosphatase family protein [Arthrobacter stackebrandtii]MBP2413189.1 putative phosphoglycerate mutase [Arthrobacter stackebrandtii]PYH01370.1 histidine phosphatase family protein [Arthrobacter stackebrandtii]
MRLILIRHGQTPNNIRGLLDTAVPGPGLTTLGLQQAEAVPTEIGGQRIDELYTSNLTRTQLTAAPLAGARTLEPLVRDGIREISAGDLEMKGDEASIMAYLKVLMSWFGGDLSARIPGADNGFEVLERFDAVVEEAAAHESVAMVSHGAMIRFWAAHRARNVDWTDPKYRMLGNTGIVTLEGEPTGSDAPGGWSLLDWHAEAAGGLHGEDIADPTGGAAEAAFGGKPNN